MSTRESKVKKLKSREYRNAYIGEYLHANIAYQVRALRKQRRWDQKKLAESANMLQPRISAIENPSNSKLNLDTLLRLANAFDVALEIRFAAFSDLLRWGESFSPDTFEVNSFDDDCYLSQPMNKLSQADMKAAMATVAFPLNRGNMTFFVNTELPPTGPVVLTTGDNTQRVPIFLRENIYGQQ